MGEIVWIGRSRRSATYGIRAKRVLRPTHFVVGTADGERRVGKPASYRGSATHYGAARRSCLARGSTGQLASTGRAAGPRRSGTPRGGAEDASRRVARSVRRLPPPSTTTRPLSSAND